jgi:hypothetical protein
MKLQNLKELFEESSAELAEWAEDLDADLEGRDDIQRHHVIQDHIPNIGSNQG